MKQLYFILTSLLLLTTFSCNKENPEEETQEETQEEMQVVCENEPFQFTIEYDGQQTQVDSCWLLYIPFDPNSTLIVNDKVAVIKWEVPGNPGWDSSFNFAYGDWDSEIESNTAYESTFMTATVIDGSSSLGYAQVYDNGIDGSIIVNVEEFNPENGFICGNFEGEALYYDASVQVSGSFKGRLNP